MTTRFRRLALALAFLAACGDGGTGPRPDDGPSGAARERQVLVRLAPGVPIERVADRYGATAVALEDRTWLLTLPPGTSTAATLARMGTDSDVAVASTNPGIDAPEAEGRSTMAFADPSLTVADLIDQAALARIGAPEAWNDSRGEGVIVAVLDTGVDPSHPALRGRVLGGVDLVDGDTDVRDPADGIDSDGDGLVDEAVDHGTFVAGIILAVAPEARILPIRVLDDDGAGGADRLARGIEIAIERGARIVNLSLGMEVESDVIEDLVHEAIDDADVVFVASAGNRGDDERRYPAGSNDVVGVAATDAGDRRAGFSSFGSWVEVAAPGVGLVGPWRNGVLATWSGTSFAAALVSGAAALLAAAEPGAEADDVADALARSARDVDDGLGGAGRLDVPRALATLRERM